ncbi:MAG TPA: type IV pilus secretin PilQ [Vicinamibacterales bacterium]|nr:type IV pilus secretin PilQ [Vicinamibacterales bacterium]
MAPYPRVRARTARLLLAGAVAAAAAGATGARAVAAREAAPARLMALSSQVNPGMTSLIIRASEPVAYAMSQPDPLTLVVDLPHVVARGFHSDFAGVPAEPIRAVSVRDTTGPDGPLARVRIALDRPVRPQVRSHRDTILVDLARQAPPAAPALPGERASTVLVRDDAGLTEDAVGGSAVPVESLAALGVNGVDPMSALRAGRSAATAPAAARQARPVPMLATPAEQVAQEEKHYTGHPVSLDFQGADLKAVLRTFSEISGLNIVIDPAVHGTVDVSLHDVPWDQALDIILRANKLGYVVDGTVVRIAPLTVLAEEEAQRRKLAEEQALSGALQTRTIALSYAKADDMQSLLTKSGIISNRGTVQVDERTNTLILTDLPEHVTQALNLIAKLDKPQPQVEIAAQIVQTNKSFARQLGVQWGFNGSLSPALGNTTAAKFPNSISAGGATGVTQGAAGTSTAVNLGVQNPTSAVGLALGSVAGAFNLDVALSALENSGNLHVLSTPRVTTQNNVEAEITQGVQIPIQTVANNTVTVTFKDAALTLRVTPQITSANTVIMRIALENAAPDFSRAVNGIPPIDTQRASTQVLVDNGQTTVIGGIVVSQQQMTNDRTPALSQLPLLGWLFKRNSTSNQDNDLLIFITPKIIRQ